MNWTDTVGLAIHSEMFNAAKKQKPDSDNEKLHKSIIRTSLSVGIARESIAKVIDAEIDALTTYRALGDEIPLMFISGLLAAADLVRHGIHVMDEQ